MLAVSSLSQGLNPMVFRIDPLRAIILGLLLALVLPHFAYAHNGAVAIAMPVEGIVIDGELSDWPEGMRQYPIVWESIGRARDEEDFFGWFRVGFNSEENALYVAVEMRDESVVIDTSGSGTPWKVQDGCELYFDILHQRQVRRIPTAALWGATFQGLSENVKVAVTREGNHHRYEWRVDVQGHSDGEVHLSSGLVLGLDIALVDKDEDGSFSWVAWGMGDGKVRQVQNIGDVVLAEDYRSIGRISGKVKWGSGGVARRMKVEIGWRDVPDRWMRTVTDPSGNFAVELPPGAYRIGSSIALRDVGEVDIDLQAEGEEWVELTLKRPQGKKARAGKGVITPARPGRRNGFWQVYGLSDGLPPAGIRAITQDRQGRLWFGTGDLGNGRGVICYDGADFVTYTTADGLADDKVNCIAEDRQGRLWFGTEGGVTCYDGERMVTFTTADGLAGDQILSILADGEGNIWLGTGDNDRKGAGGVGLSRYDGDAFATFTMEDGLGNNNIFSIAQDEKGTIWVGSGNGLSRHDGDGFQQLAVEDSTMRGGIFRIVADGREGIWFGRTGGASHFDGEVVTHLSLDDELGDRPVMEVLVDARGRLWLYPGWAGIYRFDGEEWVHFSASDGLGGDQLLSLYEDRDGALWFGIYGGGISRYDEDYIATFTKEEGLLKDLLFSVGEGLDGSIWLGYGGGGGVSRYDGEGFAHYSLGNEVANQAVWSIGRDRKGRMFFGVSFVGVYRYDREEFTYFPEKMGAWGIAMGRGREMWFAEGNGGLAHYDGEAWERFSQENGWPINGAVSVAVDRQGRVWVGTYVGVSRYDGSEFVGFSEEDGLPPGNIWSVFEDSRGQIWCGGLEGGVVRYDGEEWPRFDLDPALEAGVGSILEDDRWNMWFGTFGGGIVRYDGLATQTLHKGDGLAQNTVQKMILAQNGDIWIATEGGATRYRSRTSPPGIRMINITADRRYGDVDRVAVSSSQDFVSFKYRGASMYTPPERMVYVHRLVGHDEEWRQTNLGEVEYRDLPVGEYTFEVKAVDLDLNYSALLAVQLSVHPPYERIGLMGVVGLALVGLVVASGYGVRRRRERDRAREALMLELEEELQTAHDMQMGLMPTDSPEIEGFDVAGRCLPANHVGGDSFQYFLQDGKLSICMADVTGHAMEAAVPVMMFSGVLKSQMELDVPLDALFGRLNRTMHDSLDDRTYVCFCMGELDIAAHAFRLANAACPYPFHFHTATGEVEEMQVDAYPLGVRDGTVYTAIETVVEPGDRIVFCSDGIAEATNVQEEMFGFERTAETIRKACVEDLSAEALIDRLFGAVQDFAGETPQGDDMTIVVLKVEG